MKGLYKDYGVTYEKSVISEQKIKTRLVFMPLKKNKIRVFFVQTYKCHHRILSHVAEITKSIRQETTVFFYKITRKYYLKPLFTDL